MNRLAWVTSLLALGCGSGGQTGSADAGSDVANDVAKSCVVDFPCHVDWGCSDSTHWVEMQTVAKPPCTGLTCESTGVTHACDPGLECVTDPPSGAQQPCSYGGLEGCMPGDASTFVPMPTAAPPNRIANACDQVGIEQYWSRCIDPSTYDAGACTYWKNNYTACITCVSRVFVVAPWSVDDQNPTLVADVAGCYGFFGDSTCASKSDANMQCAAAVCKDGCENDAKAYAACAAGAVATSCSTFPRCDANASAYATCEAPSLKDFFLGFGEALCGP